MDSVSRRLKRPLLVKARRSRPGPSRPLLAGQRARRLSRSKPTPRKPILKTGGVRRYALAILAMLPLTVGAWALSIVLPTAYETWRATDQIFQSRVDREHFAEAAPLAPASMPSSVQALATATVQGTPVSALTTPIPINPASVAGPSATPDRQAGPTTTTPTQVSRFNPGALTAATPTATSPGPTPTPYPDWDGDDPVHIMLLGVDTRPSEGTDGRSDTIIVVRIDPAEKRVDMFSIPRDLAVDIPGFSTGVKINSAYPWGEIYDVPGGGPSLVAQTIEYNFGVPIDYYATVDIPGLEKIVDTIGGVVLDSDNQLKDDQYPTEDYGYTRAYFPSGLQKLDGKRAVQYARTRHSDGDFRRAERQQQLLLAIRDQAFASGLITTLPALISDLGDTVRTDLSPRQVLSLASLSQSIERENIWIHSLAPYTYASVTDQGWFLLGDWDALRWTTQNLADNPLATNIPGD